MKTAQELIEFIQTETIQRQLFNLYEEENYDLTEEQQQFLGPIENKETICNSDEMYCVIYLPNHDIFLKLTGEYDSYGNSDHYYDNTVTVVTPKQQTITVYE